MKPENDHRLYYGSGARVAEMRYERFTDKILSYGFSRPIIVIGRHEDFRLAHAVVYRKTGVSMGRIVPIVANSKASSVCVHVRSETV